MENTVGELLIRIKNASLAKHQSLVLPYSNFAEKLAQFLVKEGYLEKAEKVETKTKQKTLRVTLKLLDHQPKIINVRQISKPGQRVYLQVRQMSRFRRWGPGVVILSTPTGLSSLKEAKKEKIGGELLCEVW